MDLPTIFIFDLDQTIIGESGTLLAFDDLIKFIKYACKSKELPEKICTKQLLTLTKMVSPSMIRPGLAELLTGIKKNFPTAELFIYSAGTHEYVQKFVSIVEQQIGNGVLFNRPLFSRTECFMDEYNQRSKSISSQLPVIVNTLKTRYKGLRKPDIDPIKLLKDRMIFIDDSDVVWDMSNRQIKCPEFKYHQVCHLDQEVLRLFYNEPVLQKFILNNKWLYIYADNENDKSTNFDEFMMRYHLYMASVYQMILADNKNALSDDFFYRLEKAIRPYAHQAKPFTDEHIRKIQKLVG